MPSPGTLLHLLALLVAVAADVARRLAGLARSASFRLSMRKRLLEVVSSTEQRDRELPVERYGAEQEAAAEPCAFCLSGIEEGDEVRVLRCRHLFHRCCLDRWLAARPWATCPLCRGELLTAATCAGEEQEEEGFGGPGMVMFAAYVRRCSWFWRFRM